MSPFEQIANSIAPADGQGQSSAYWMVVIVTTLAAVVGLFYGRRFFWIFAGLVGIMVGQVISGLLVGPLPVLSSLLELAFGAVVGLIASAAPWPVAFVLVFIGTGWIAAEVAYWFTEYNFVFWICFFVAGWLGVMLLRVAYEETLIAVSAVFSALLLSFVVSEFFPRLRQWETMLVLAILIAAGAIKQGLDLRRERRQPYILPASVGGAAPDKRQ